MAYSLRCYLQLTRVQGVLDSERGRIARHFCASASSVPKEDSVPSSNIRVEHGKRVRDSMFFQDRQSGKELQTFMGDMEKFKDYKPPSSAASAAPAESKSQSEPEELKQDKEASETPEPNVTKAEQASHSGDRIFSSPVAKKFAEDNNHKRYWSRWAYFPVFYWYKKNNPHLSVDKGSKKEAAAAPSLGYVDLQNTQIRKVTANRLLLSKQTIPHYYLTVDARVDKLIKYGLRLNYWVHFSAQNNVAVQTDHGLFVPVIRGADKKGLSTIADEGGTFTVSNLGGPFGMKQFWLLASVTSLSCDHRVIDGAEWLKAFKGYSHNLHSRNMAGRQWSSSDAMCQALSKTKGETRIWMVQDVVFILLSRLYMNMF
ncbi:hypothetical protein SETIT_4G003700v2 [Setaria italica]|uniref:2-oxoacid dehydrogenase acyltransferase catalytic domain-containing protein n=1 Tax=Setaria italica TaxID=4555 RepID=A0A368QPP7_SETIT|nr:hypothetical protein SETIT_4G003700v2 [Setaria italica]